MTRFRTENIIVRYVRPGVTMRPIGLKTKNQGVFRVGPLRKGRWLPIGDFRSIEEAMNWERYTRWRLSEVIDHGEDWDE